MIHVSVQKQHEQEQQIAQRMRQQDSNTSLRHGDAQLRPHNNNNNNSSNNAEALSSPRDASSASWAQAAKLRLQLNDASAAIASAVGFGGMNAILLYGTLWASEGSNVGVLYENSCPNVPSLAVSAVLANFFFVLQTFWMLMTFFGMRRRQLYHRGESEVMMMTSTSSPRSNNNTSNSATAATAAVNGGFWGNSRHGGNWALLACLLTHLLSSLLTLTNALPSGCLVSVPAVGGVVLLTAYLFWAGCGRNYMPPATQDDLFAISQQRHWD